MNTDLALQQTITDLVRVYEAAKAEITDCFDRLRKTEEDLNQSFSRKDWAQIHLKDSYHHLVLNTEATLAHIRKDAWALIIERLELRRLLSIQRWNELEKMVEKDELPEISVEAVAGVLQSFMDQASSMLEEAVDEVFELLRPHNSQYKTNTEEEIGHRVILSWIVESYYSGRYTVNYRQHPMLSAIERVFMALDGARTDTRNHYSDLAKAIGECSKESNAFETPYFKGRVHKNGNLHLEFKRLDLLKRLNQIAGGRRLRKGQAA